MKYRPEINLRAFDGDWHPAPPENIPGFINNICNCNEDKYKDLMLTSLVKADILKSLKLELRRYNSVKNLCITNGDKVEVVYCDSLELKYIFGKVINFDINRICLDCSNECTSKVVYIPIQNIRDIEIFYGTYILDSSKNTYTNNNGSINDQNCNIVIIPKQYYTQDNVDSLISWVNGSLSD